MTRLYHGSNQEIGEIDLSLGLPDKDFGQGFYLTHLRQLASKITFPKDNSQHFFATERAVSLLKKVEVITL